MQSTVQRFAMVSVVIAASAGLAAGSAQAAVSTTTLPATSVTTSAAFLNGTVATGGAAVLWQFEYGTTGSYGKTTPVQEILAGQGMVHVLDRIGGLKPGTKYHFRLDAETGNAVTYPLFVYFGHDRSFFTTKRLGLNITSAKLSVRNGRASIPVTCPGAQTCKGKLTLTLRRAGRTPTLASDSFAIRAGRKSTLKPKLSKTALKLLKNARGHRLGAKLTAKSSVGQPKLIQNVTLILK